MFDPTKFKLRISKTAETYHRVRVSSRVHPGQAKTPSQATGVLHSWVQIPFRPAAPWELVGEVRCWFISGTGSGPVTKNSRKIVGPKHLLITQSYRLTHQEKHKIPIIFGIFNQHFLYLEMPTCVGENLAWHLFALVREQFWVTSFIRLIVHCIYVTLCN